MRSRPIRGSEAARSDLPRAVGYKLEPSKPSLSGPFAISANSIPGERMAIPDRAERMSAAGLSSHLFDVQSKY